MRVTGRRSSPVRLPVVIALACVALTVAPAAASATTRFVSPAGGDSGACVAGPCKSLGYAYKQSAPGDVVEVAGGSYPAQSIPLVAGRTAPAVEFHPAAGATVSLTDTAIAGDFVTLRNIQTGDLTIDRTSGAGDVQGVTVIAGGGPGMYIGDARDVLIQGGSWGPKDNLALITLGGGSNITFDGLDVHDAVATNATAHLECIYASSVQGFTVRNSIFRNCAYFAIFFTQLGGPDPKDVLLENNVFEQTYTYGMDKAPYSVNVSDHLAKMENYTLRNNTFATSLALQPPTIVGSKFVGNVGADSPCVSGITFSHNVWADGTCSATDKKVPALMSQFVDPAGHNWHLKAGAGAIDAADPGDAPATDRDGFGRVGAPDAGAHEFGAGPLTPPCTCGAPAPVTPGATPPAGSAAAPGGTSLTPAQSLKGGLLPTSAAPVRRVRLSALSICAARKRAGCESAARLRVTLSKPAKLVLRVRRIGARNRQTTKRVLRLSGHKGENLFRIRGAGLARGRYRLALAATVAGRASAPVTLGLRVR